MRNNETRTGRSYLCCNYLTKANDLACVGCGRGNRGELLRRPRNSRTFLEKKVVVCRYHPMFIEIYHFQLFEENSWLSAQGAGEINFLIRVQVKYTVRSARALKLLLHDEYEAIKAISRFNHLLGAPFTVLGNSRKKFRV
jgi:hypothetical protein